MQTAALTNEQRKFAEEHHGLIYVFLNKFKLPCEDWYGVAAIGYCKAVIRYDPDREWAFSTFAFCVMLNDVRMEMRTARAQKRRAILVSLQSEVGDGLTLEDTLGYEQSFTEDVTPTSADIFIRALLPEQRLIISFLADGEKQGSIAKTMGVTRGQIAKQVKAIREKYNNEFPRREDVYV